MSTHIFSVLLLGLLLACASQGSLSSHEKRQQDLNQQYTFREEGQASRVR